MNIQVRDALQSDQQAITEIVTTAFGNVQGQEVADLVNDLVTDPSAQPLLSLVATANGKVIGYILFTNAHVEDSQRQILAAILAPLAVKPEYQNKGIGGRLIKEGLERVKTAGVKLVFVLGHPNYYPKFGFSTAGIEGFKAPYPIPPENSDAWMVQELEPGYIGNVRGKVDCASALNDPKHWRE